MGFIDWFCNNPTEKDLTEQCTCNWEIATIHLQWCKYWKMVSRELEIYYSKPPLKSYNTWKVDKTYNTN